MGVAGICSQIGEGKGRVEITYLRNCIRTLLRLPFEGAPLDLEVDGCAKPFKSSALRPGKS